MLMMLGMFVDVLQTHAGVADDAWCTFRMGQKPKHHDAGGARYSCCLGKELMMLCAFSTRKADADDARWVCGMGMEQNS